MNYENMHTLKSRLGNYDAGTLLDIAVGRGDFLKFALSSFRTWKSAAGIDIDSDTLRIANSELSAYPVILIHGSALALPFVSQYFDTITLSNTLHHIDALPALFAETVRVCQNKGLIVINEMLNETHSLVQESYMIYHRFIAEVDNQLGRFHREPFTFRELQAIIKNSTLTQLDCFVHEETTGDCLKHEEITAMTERLRKKVQQLRGTDFYYFYENKAKDIIRRLEETGVYRPRHVTFLLQPS
jgi:ubiquinone/menaquinone biosynthesis C-methylase UbiE